jgi:hypothetical protein
MTNILIDSNQVLLQYALTNPTHTSPRGYNWVKGDMNTRAYLSDGIVVRGVHYRDSEEAYQKLKSTTDTTFELMVEILLVKLNTYPKLIGGIIDSGGLKYLNRCIHQPTKFTSVWTTNGNDWFIKALIEAYKQSSRTLAEPFDIKLEKVDISKGKELFDKLPTQTTKTFTYAGIGSRQTPENVMILMNKLASHLEQKGYTLNSGNALGADKAFEGKPQPFEKSGDIVIRWSSYKYKVKKKQIFTASMVNDKMRDIAIYIHPNGRNLKDYILDLHARSLLQIFGTNLDTLVDFVLCWTKDGCESHDTRTSSTGGTGQAISYASLKGIPVINISNADWRDRLIEILSK